MGHGDVDFLGGLVAGSLREGISNVVAFVGGMANGEYELGKEVEPSSLAWGDVFLGEDGRNDGVVSADGEVLSVEVRAPDCEGMNHGEEFLLVGGVIHLRGKELLACEGDGISVGWSLGIANPTRHFYVTIDASDFAIEFVERVRDLGKVANERAVIVGKAEEGTELEEGLGRGVLDEGCDIRGVHTDAFSGDNVAKVFDARSGKRTFVVLGVEFLLSEDREDLANVLKVGLEGGAKDEDVIKVHRNTDFEEVTKDVVHDVLECGGGIGESERHYEELVVPKPRAECDLVGVLLADMDLVEATAEVDLGEIFGSTEAIKDPGEWVLVLDRDLVQGTVVCAHEEFRGVVLLDEESIGSEGGGARLNESFSKEFIELALHFFSLGDRELVRRAGSRSMMWDTPRSGGKPAGKDSGKTSLNSERRAVM
ncbi:hypothetical protein CBR_g23558 [Chara braunii]|uniref:Uncharacterized protein n=1 Tax=Chara braunii TaxID=69332 RepID=A0A388L4J8_CHABU|nr:hypothetical protein CBR_g23558 [Chara braunii]|eukprot:GBG77231.1 hypothetical protein CBR_g23558 [Chara braunii]